MRQRIRKTTLLISLILFPITMWYFSPYIIINAAMEHVINGSFIVFAAMFVFSIVFWKSLVRIPVSGGRASGMCISDQRNTCEAGET